MDDHNLLRQAGTLKSWPGSSSRLPRLNADTLIIAGAEDRIIPAQNAKLLAERIPKAEIVHIRNGGHGFFFQFPQLTARSVNRFLGSK